MLAQAREGHEVTFSKNGTSLISQSKEKGAKEKNRIFAVKQKLK